MRIVVRLGEDGRVELFHDAGHLVAVGLRDEQGEERWSVVPSAVLTVLRERSRPSSPVAFDTEPLEPSELGQAEKVTARETGRHRFGPEGLGRVSEGDRE